MNTLELRSPAKVNLRLKVVGRQVDGYHLLSMLNLKVNFCDVLTFEKSDQNSFEITSCYADSAASILMDRNNNLIFKAIDLFADICSLKPRLKVKLAKHIPLGAGLAGGSSNAATTLKALMQLYDEQLSSEQKAQVIKESLKLGADVPFFFYDSIAIVTGIGENVVNVKCSELDKLKIILCLPNEQINTVDAFNLMRAKLSEQDLHKDQQIDSLLSCHNFSEFYDLLKLLIENDFEQLMPDLNPSLADLIFEVRASSGQIVGLSGSGASFFVLANNPQDFSFLDKINDSQLKILQCSCFENI